MVDIISKLMENFDSSMLLIKDQDKRIDQEKVYLEKKINPKKINKKLIYLTITIVILLAIYLMK